MCPVNIFQQDNACIHLEDISINCLNDVEVLPWSGKFPDMFPTKHVGPAQTPS